MSIDYQAVVCHDTTMMSFLIRLHHIVDCFLKVIDITNVSPWTKYPHFGKNLLTVSERLWSLYKDVSFDSAWGGDKQSIQCWSDIPIEERLILSGTRYIYTIARQSWTM
jgi:hypothetical protein